MGLCRAMSPSKTITGCHIAVPPGRSAQWLAIALRGDKPTSHQQKQATPPSLSGSFRPPPKGPVFIWIALSSKNTKAVLSLHRPLTGVLDYKSPPATCHSEMHCILLSFPSLALDMYTLRPLGGCILIRLRRFWIFIP